MHANLLVVSPEPAALLRAYAHLFDSRVRPALARDPDEALHSLAENGPFAVVLCRLDLPPDPYARFLDAVGKADPLAVRIVITDPAHLHGAPSTLSDGGVFLFMDEAREPMRLVQAVHEALDYHDALAAKRRRSTGLLTGEEIAFLIGDEGEEGAHAPAPELQGDPGLHFEASLEQLIAQAERSGSMLGILTLEPLAPDEGFSLFASHVELVRTLLRKSDSLIPMAGGRLLVVLWNLARAEDLRGVARHIARELADAGLGVRSGTSIYPLDGTTPERLLSRAESRQEVARPIS